MREQLTPTTCDECRRRRKKCTLDTEGQCELCRRLSIACTFNQPTYKAGRTSLADKILEQRLAWQRQQDQSHSLSQPQLAIAGPDDIPVADPAFLDALSAVSGVSLCEEPSETLRGPRAPLSDSIIPIARRPAPSEAHLSHCLLLSSRGLEAWPRSKLPVRRCDLLLQDRTIKLHDSVQWRVLLNQPVDDMFASDTIVSEHEFDQLCHFGASLMNNPIATLHFQRNNSILFANFVVDFAPADEIEACISIDRSQSRNVSTRRAERFLLAKHLLGCMSSTSDLVRLRIGQLHALGSTLLWERDVSSLQWALMHPGAAPKEELTIFWLAALLGLQQYRRTRFGLDEDISAFDAEIQLLRREGFLERLWDGCRGDKYLSQLFVRQIGIVHTKIIDLRLWKDADIGLRLNRVFQYTGGVRKFDRELIEEGGRWSAAEVAHRALMHSLNCIAEDVLDMNLPSMPSCEEKCTAAFALRPRLVEWAMACSSPDSLPRNTDPNRDALMTRFVALRGRYNILIQLIATALSVSEDENAAAQIQKWQLPATESEREAMIASLSAEVKAHDVFPLQLRTASVGFQQ